jgi:hypothetical protein
MHHENHVRKTSYKNIKQTKTWQQVMGLRNRRQIPVCRNCHRNIIHKGKYQGEPLKSKAIEMYDNRIVNIERISTRCLILIKFIKIRND